MKETAFEMILGILFSFSDQTGKINRYKSVELRSLSRSSLFLLFFMLQHKFF